MTDSLSASSQSFFSATASLFFAVIVAVRATEILRHFEVRSENYRHLQGVIEIAALGLVVALAPLVVAELQDCIRISALAFAVIASVLIARTFFLVAKRDLHFVFPKVAWVAIGASVPFVVVLWMLAAGAPMPIPTQSAYKAALAWLLLLLSLRLYLVVGHVFTASTTRKLTARSRRE
jgi:hypothetical protein